MSLLPGDGDATIFALSSGAPPAAIAVVRISGVLAAEALVRLCGSMPEPRRAAVRGLRRHDDELLDRALVVWFPGPATATGEDLAELQLHGGRAVVAAVLAELATIEGCRPALPGEFTRRAFVNGRIDLAEAEGLADLLAAETEIARRQALRVAEGGLSRLAEEWRQRALMLSARAEAQLEFGDDAGDVLPDPALDADIAALAETLKAGLASAPAERLRDGFRVVVAGPPNAGKSTLINALAGRDAAIVSAEAGTTRDIIEVPVQLDGLPILLIDSAGLREPDGEIERIGIGLAQRAIAAADVVLWLGLPDDAPPSDVIRIHARADAPGRAIPLERADLSISAMTGSGLPELRQQLFHRLYDNLPPGNAPLLNDRQRMLAAEASAILEQAGRPDLPEIKAEHLRRVAGIIDRITGKAGVEDMLDALFGRFCLGK